MENGKHRVYEFGGFQLDPARQKLFCRGQPVALAPKLFETLVFLVVNRDRTLLKDELMQALWAGTFVEEANLSQNIFLLRKALGDDRNGHSFIHTVPRRGYRFIAPVTEMESESIISPPGGRDVEFWKQNSPFRSLTVFEEEDAWLFFGREAETADLVSRVEQSAVVALVGNSGSGKSSLLRAGLIPALRESRLSRVNGSAHGMGSGESWRIAVFRPSAAPFDYLAEVLPGQLAPELSVTEQAEFISDCKAKLPDGDASRNAVAALVSAADSRAGHHGQTRVLLLADQFEELFTLTAKPEVRDRYIDALLSAARLDSAVPVHLVLSLRADFYGHCLDHPGLSRCLETSFNLGSMKPDQMRETIEKRLQLAGGRAEPGLIDSVLEDVGEEPGNLALLEHALGQLWEQCGGPGCTFTNFAYNQMGRLRGALGRHADAVLESLDEERKHLAHKIFLELVHLGEGAQDTRRRVAKAELMALGESAQVEELLTRLTSSRLIAMGREGEATFVEVSHEALIREWPALREWLAENREDLSLERRLLQAAEEWHDLNGDPGALLQGARLVQAEDWLARHEETTDLVREHVHASVEARAEARRKELEARQRELARQKQTARRFRWFARAVSVLLLVAVGSAWFAYHQRVLEKSRAMAAQAEELAARDHGRALDLAIGSWRVAKTEESRTAVLRTFPEVSFTASHGDAVYRAVFSPDGRRILSASLDHTAKLWDARSGRLISVLQHDGPVEHAEFSGDGERIVTASDDGTARVWSGTTGNLLTILNGHKQTVWRAEFSPDGKLVVTASLDNTARIWESASGRLVAVLRGHTAMVVTAKFSTDSRLVVTASHDKKACIWTNNGKLLKCLTGHTSAVAHAAFFPGNKHIVTAGWDRTARIWDSESGRLLHTLFHDAVVGAIGFSSDGRLVTGSHDGTAKVWNPSDGRLLFTLRHDGPVQYVEFSRDNRYIITSSFDHTARVWRSDNGDLRAILAEHAGTVYHAAFSPDGKRIVTASADNYVRVWNTIVGWPEVQLRGPAPFMDASFSIDGQRILTATSGHSAQLWSSATGRLITTLQTTDGVWQAVFSPDETNVAGTGGREVPVWNTAKGRLLFVLKGHSDVVVSASFSPDGERIATASRDGSVRIWSMLDGRLLGICEVAGGPPWQAMFSPDGRRIVTAHDDWTARIWDAFDFRPLAVLRGHTSSVVRAQFSPDGLRVVTASADHTARLWDSSNGHELAILKGHTGYVSRAQYSGDGQRIVTASLDGTARLWNSRDGRLLAVLDNHNAQIVEAWFSPDNRRIVTASINYTARVWDSSDGSPLTILKGHNAQVVQARFSPDGQRVVTASFDKTARIWQILTLDDIERILSK